MKITILIIWLHWGYPATAASMTQAVFQSPEACAVALKAAKQEDDMVQGVCVLQGRTP